jgi:hypothetical protein
MNMDGLDLSGLSDDQLVELARACCLEAVRRNPAVAEAMRDAMLSEAEKARIAETATYAELAAARARERERIALEAAARVKAKEHAATAARIAEQAKEKARQAKEKALAVMHRDIALLRQAGELVGRRPATLSLLYVLTKHGRQVYINPSSDRYTHDHLCAFNIKTGEIRSTAALVKHKPALAEFCASLTEHVPLDTHIVGRNYEWPAVPTNEEASS